MGSRRTLNRPPTRRLDTCSATQPNNAVLPTPGSPPHHQHPTLTRANRQPLFCLPKAQVYRKPGRLSGDELDVHLLWIERDVSGDRGDGWVRLRVSPQRVRYIRTMIGAVIDAVAVGRGQAVIGGLTLVRAVGRGGTRQQRRKIDVGRGM
jgi:hypothetical protein